ncbi:hypothetical protein MMC13_000749 [Lambiella insularis]|nr:hypothetical protein [Lambiella insularis]
MKHEKFPLTKPHAPAWQAVPGLSFWILPPEVRLQIYELVLCSPLRLVVCGPEPKFSEEDRCLHCRQHISGPTAPWPTSSLWPTSSDNINILDFKYLLRKQEISELAANSNVALLSTCRTIFNEATAIYRTKNTFYFHASTFLRYDYQIGYEYSNKATNLSWLYTQLTSLFLTVYPDKCAINVLSLLKACSALQILRIGFWTDSHIYQYVLDKIKAVVQGLSSVRVFELWRFGAHRLQWANLVVEMGPEFYPDCVAEYGTKKRLHDRRIEADILEGLLGREKGLDTR